MIAAADPTPQAIAAARAPVPVDTTASGLSILSKRGGASIRCRPRLLFPENPPRVLFAHLVGDAFVREADEVRKRSVRPTATTRKRRYQAGKRRPRVAIESP